MTLDEMLALLADNQTGAISAADMRAVVTGLYEWATTMDQAEFYLWTAGTTTPASGRISMGAWNTGPQTLYLNETTDDGEQLTFSNVDGAPVRSLWLATGTGKKITADITGNSVDLGTYRTMPVNVTTLTGAAPATGDRITLSFFVRRA